MKNLRSVPKPKIIQMIRKMKAAIKENCYDCTGGQKRLDCKNKNCALYQFRPWAKVAAKDDFSKNN